MITISLYYKDLSEEMKRKIVSIFGDNNNWDTIPIATMEIEDPREITLDSFLGDKNIPSTPEDLAREYAYRQWEAEAADEDENPNAVSFEYEGQSITNPWIDPSARFPYTTAEAIKKYGRENVENFIAQVMKKLGK